jgi:branched-chain amino acid transport system substrate-binding protein
MNRAHVLGIAVALALGVAACGKEEPKKEAAKPAAPPPPAGVTVKIAHAGPLTGSIAHLGKDDENGVALAVAQLNAQKINIDGKPVTFSMQSEDDQADPKTGATVAQKLVDAKVAAVIGHLNSGRLDPGFRDLHEGRHPDDLGLGHEPDAHRAQHEDGVPHRSAVTTSRARRSPPTSRTS